MNLSLTDKLTENIKLAQDTPLMQHEIYVNPFPKEAKHEFLFFIKPELTLRDKNINLPAILKMMFDKLNDYHFEIRDIRILGAQYLDRFNIIAQHYGVINAMSRKPLQFITSDGSDKFSSVFGKLPAETDLLGSLEFLSHFPDYDPDSLDELWQKSSAVKLAGGTYCAPVHAGGKEIFLINGFHPRQLVHFTQKGRSIVAFSLAGDIDWTTARNNFIGKTNPAEALPGSLRSGLLKYRNEFGLDAVNSSRNGFHLSAGPVEGLVELMRYCSDFTDNNIRQITDFKFGKQLIDEFGAVRAKKFCENVFVTRNGSRISVFDLTEEKNSDEALKLLEESKID